MSELAVYFGPAARDSMCRIFDGAERSISGEFYDLKDPAVKAALARARSRGVKVDIGVEHRRHSFDSHPILHAKAAVVDDRTTIIATANVTRSGFASPGEVCVVDERADDARAVRSAVEGRACRPAADPRIIAGPSAAVRDSIETLFRSRADLRVASEDLSDERIVRALIARRALGHDDRVLINYHGALSRQQRRTVCRLDGAGVAVRAPADDYMHEKYVDDGDRIYVGSANLTRNGLDEGKEIGIVAAAGDFGSGANELRARFDELWSSSPPV